MKNKKDCKHENMSIGTLHDYCNECGSTVLSQGHIDIQTNEKIKRDNQQKRNNFFKTK